MTVITPDTGTDETAWARWGFFGMFLFLSAIFLAVGWIIDRRNKRRYDSLGDAT